MATNCRRKQSDRILTKDASVWSVWHDDHDDAASMILVARETLNPTQQVLQRMGRHCFIDRLQHAASQPCEKVWHNCHSRILREHQLGKSDSSEKSKQHYSLLRIFSRKHTGLGKKQLSWRYRIKGPGQNGSWDSWKRTCAVRSTSVTGRYPRLQNTSVSLLQSTSEPLRGLPINSLG